MSAQRGIKLEIRSPGRPSAFDDPAYAGRRRACADQAAATAPNTLAIHQHDAGLGSVKQRLGDAYRTMKRRQYRAHPKWRTAHLFHHVRPFYAHRLPAER